MHNRLHALKVFAIALALVSTAASAMTLREFRALEKSNKQGENYGNYYLVGVMEGALEAHTQDVRNGTKPAICLNGRRLQPSMARGMFDTELKRNEGVYEADMSVQLVLTNALATVYPC
jgi:type II secretory pathway component PulK